ncbi:MAG: hypothetical protein Greene101447_167 [Parcubacteria group bacterium Greene1014_47]|nr:MAG: hypothetical protein Greene101447_167 [Parcubacteria group bacterium Greene1014_47]
MGFFNKLKNSMGVEAEEVKEKQEEEETENKEEKQPKKGKKIEVKMSKKEKEWFEPEGELAVDVYQTDQEIVIQSTVAGVGPDDLDINMENDVVTISGTRNNPNPEEEKNYFYQECYWGPFSRQIILPEEVDINRIEASLKDGIFTLRLPKMERQKVRKIKIRG